MVKQLASAYKITVQAIQRQFTMWQKISSSQIIYIYIQFKYQTCTQKVFMFEPTWMQISDVHLQQPVYIINMTLL